MDDGPITLIVALICLVALSAFFSSSETAYSSLNIIRLKSRSEDGDARAKRVLHLAEQYDSLLSTILIGNNIVNIAAATIATILFTSYVSEQYGATLSTAVLTIVILIFGEITPKSMAKEMPETFAIASAPVLQILMVVFSPANKLFQHWKRFLQARFQSNEVDGITEGELMTMVSEAESDGGITDRESELIRSAIEFDDVEVEDVLTPRVDVIALEDDVTMTQLGDLFEESGFSRLPVYHDTIDNIIGVVHEKDYHIAHRKGVTNIETLITPTLYTTGSTQISELLRTLRERHHHLAVVVDEYGGTEGIVTLEDILEELVGEIWDEHDEAVEDIRHQRDNTWLVSGSANVDDLFEALNIKETSEAVTVSGLVQEQLKRLPKVSDRFGIGNYLCTVTRAAHRRVQEVRFVELPKEAETEEKSTKPFAVKQSKSQASKA
ncbi:MAG: hemolysin family protein [Faecalibacterium sp.]